MGTHSLKIKVTVNIAIVLILAMILTDLIMIFIGQQDYIRSEVSKGNLVSLMIENKLEFLSEAEKIQPDSSHTRFIKEVVEESGFTYLQVTDLKGKQIIRLGKESRGRKEIDLLAGKAISSGESLNQLSGATWGVFLKQRQYLILSVPLYFENRIIASVSMVSDLDRYYTLQRKSQRYILIYIFINTIIFSLFGFYRIYKIAIKPIGKLVKRAEDYSDEDGFGFLYDKEKNEFGLLSMSLSRMLKRISNDKESLQASLQSLEKAQNETIRAEKLASVGRLSAGIAHEIGNPIGIVLGYLGLLKSHSISDDERNEYILRSENEISRINTIIRQLLDFSRPSTGVIENVSLHDIILETADILKVQPVMTGVSVRYELLAEMDTVKADSNQLRQIVLNLMLNAADAIASSDDNKDGKLIIKSENVNIHDSHNGCERRVIQVMVIDNGPGIPCENLDTIFDPFYTTKEPGTGTGLGLSVCFMIIEGLGGTIKAKSSREEGTAIIICLPVVNS